MAKKTEGKKQAEVFVLDFEKVVPKTLNGTVNNIKNLNETLGDILDRNLSGIRGRRLAEKIFDGGKVELSASEKDVLSAFLNSDNCTLVSYVAISVLKELEG